MKDAAAPPPALLVTSPGFATTVQDLGRLGWQRFGVPVSGALDRVALAAANVVAGNPPDFAALECLYGGCALKVMAPSVRCALAGAGASLEIATGEGRPLRGIPQLESATLAHGDVVAVRLAGPSVSAYFAVEGGIAVPDVLGSRSTYTRAAMGGYEGRRLLAGDALPLAAPAAANCDERRLPGVDLSPQGTIRIVLGPQEEAFSAAAIEVLRHATYSVSASSDRMGLRLQGPRLAHVAGADIVSDGIPPGAIQVPGDGLPIIMLADRQTTGGYTKIATVISADLPLLGRISPGAQLRFEIIDVEAAEALARELAYQIASWPARLQSCAPSPAALQLALLRCNLVSGVSDALRPFDQDALNV